MAWLRILEYKDSKRGWSVVLENAGYNLDEVNYILEGEDYPKNMLEFRDGLKDIDDLVTVSKTVFDRYGIDDAFSGKVIEVLDHTFSSSYMNLGEIIQFMEENIDSDETYEVDNSLEENVATVQTIHGAKGLEYPVVFVSDVNSGAFPSYGRGSGRIQYEDPIGLRQKKRYVGGDLPYLYDNWRAEVLNKCLSRGYDEERRLMYVAMSRAKKYLYVTADPEQKSQFFKDLNLPKDYIEPSLEISEETRIEESEFEIEEIEERGLVKLGMKSVIGETRSHGRGEELGTQVHRFAELYAKNRDIEPRNRDEENVKEFIDDLSGEKLVEKRCCLPLEIKGRKVVLNGKIDLIHLKENKVEVIDYKTEKSKETKQPYKRQLSLYHQSINEIFEDKKVVPYIFYTKNSEKEDIKPIKKEKLIKKHLKQVLL
ncbi:hypothetical protein C9439_00095 [archaeon SCG-AAA382B04]|nr:hypothetical protein C9439_00095 [archaeon SCG-AAA382B04]